MLAGTLEETSLCLDLGNEQMKSRQHLRLTESSDIPTYSGKVRSRRIEPWALRERQQKAKLCPALFFCRLEGLCDLDSSSELVYGVVRRTPIPQDATNDDMTPRPFQRRHVVANQNSLSDRHRAAVITCPLQKFSEKRVPRGGLLLRSTN